LTVTKIILRFIVACLCSQGRLCVAPCDEIVIIARGQEEDGYV